MFPDGDFVIETLAPAAKPGRKPVVGVVSDMKVEGVASPAARRRMRS